MTTSPAVADVANKSVTFEGTAYTIQELGEDTYTVLVKGAWLDGRSARGAYVHRYGLFNLQPDLAWGAWPIANDARGGYYRVDYQRARWSWNAGSAGKYCG